MSQSTALSTCEQSTEERVVDYTSGFRQPQDPASPSAALATPLPLAEDDQMSEGALYCLCHASSEILTPSQAARFRGTHAPGRT